MSRRTKHTAEFKAEVARKALKDITYTPLFDSGNRLVQQKSSVLEVI